MGDAGSQLAERSELLRLDQAVLRRLQLAKRAFGGVLCRSDPFLGLFALGNVAVDRDEPASRHRIDAHFQNATVRPRPLNSPLTVRALDIAMQFCFEIDIPELAALNQIGHVVAISPWLGKK